MPFHEGPRVSLGLQELPKGYAFIKMFGLRLGRAEKPDDVPQHPPVPGHDEVAGVSHHLQKRVARVFAVPAIKRNAETHQRRRGRHIEVVKQRHQVWISGGVVDNKARIHGNRPVGCQTVNRVGMTANAVLGFNERHVMALRQQPGGGKSRYSRADDGNSVRIQAIQAFP